MIICAYCNNAAEKTGMKGWTEISGTLQEYHLCQPCCNEHQKKSYRDIQFRKAFDEKVKLFITSKIQTN